METYVQKAPDSSFIDLVEDDDFKSDLVKFFSGGRYKYTENEMREMGFENLTKDFIEHMRAQSVNEVTATKDLNYVRNKDFSYKGKQAFGRLTQAWDSSKEAGTGFFDGLGDFAEGAITAPSTYLGFASFGLGKVGAKIASKGVQLAVRAGLKETLKKNVLKSSIARQSVKDAGTGAVTGAAVSGFQGKQQGKTREELGVGPEYTAKDLIFDSTVGAVAEGTFGAATGYISGVVGRGRAKKVEDVMLERNTTFKKQAEEAAKKSLGTIKAASDAEKKQAMNIVADVEDILSARAGVKGAKIKGRLDPERVAKGRAILNAMSDPKANPEFSSGLSVQTMRGIAAASVDLMRDLKLDTKSGDIRITEAIANKLRDGEGQEVFTILKNVKDKYGLSKDEFSMIYLSEVSRAGQTLGFQSAIKRGAKINLDEASDIDILFSKGASSISSQDAQEISAAAVRNSRNVGVRFLQDLDTMRISFMTSQPATTMRNLTNVGILIGTDMVDQVNKAIYKGLTGDASQIKTFIPNITSVVRGLSFNNTEAKLLRQIMLEEMPEQSMRLYNQAMRLEVGMESSGVLARVGRFVNMANTLSDSVFKEGIFYGNLERQFRDKGMSMSDWLRTNTKLEDLPEGIDLNLAVDDANRLTMQRDFRGADSVLASTTRGLVNLNRKVPFLVSAAAGVPFPRYLGNHLQMVSDYAPILGEMLHRSGLTEGARDDATRYARQTTGAMMLFAGYQIAKDRDGEVDYGSIKNELRAQEDLKPLLGAAMFHMYLGDQAWRKENGLPTSFDNTDQLKRDLQDVLGGIPEFSFDLGIPVAILDAVAKQKITPDLEKNFGDFLSTFTMPGAIARDLIGQADYDQAGNPYTRELAITDDVKLDYSGAEMTNRALRMLPDVRSRQYLQSFNDETDIAYYDFDNPVARGKVNPALKQITGRTAEPPLTTLQKEMSRYNLKNWQIYGSTATKSANVDLVLRERLAKSMYKDFENWKSKAPASKKYGEMTYDEIVASDSISNLDKATLLEGWITKKIRKEREQVEDLFDSFVAESPVKARGYIRNNYIIYSKDKGGKQNLNTAAQTLGFNTADEYLAESETISDELTRRMKLLAIVPNIRENEPYD
tara:strand:- start:1123 stop:4467 length:3345 start_codon:yes stop_codon:yes gene_type:complete